MLITLVLKEDLLVESSNEIVIKRNFLQRNKKIMSINGQNLTKDKGKDFEKKLLISHYIRYQDNKVSKTLRVLSTWSTNIEYETLHLFMFGFPVSDRSQLNTKLKGEQEYRKRLEKHRSKTELELQLDIVKKNILVLEKRKTSLNINENYKNDLEKLNDLKYRISVVSSRISELSVRQQLLKETEMELNSDMSEINLPELREIYKTAKKDISNIQIQEESYSTNYLSIQHKSGYLYICTKYEFCETVS
ncbi:hypothetical protein ABIC22_004799 [Paenibacillus sp. PvP094]|uniref:hypothetical protein n=1 Tax=Paenibacillus sp. PvP094 TaxID=3156394 RepID=UPI0033940FD7